MMSINQDALLERVRDHELVGNYMRAVEATDCGRDHPDNRDSNGFGEDMLRQAIADCVRFVETCGIDTIRRCYEAGYRDDELGCDFWLARNGYGKGLPSRLPGD